MARGSGNKGTGSKGTSRRPRGMSSLLRGELPDSPQPAAPAGRTPFDGTLSAREQAFVEELHELRPGAVRLPEGNLTHPYLLRQLLASVSDYSVGLWNEDDPEDETVELILELQPKLDFETGLQLGWALPVVFDCSSWDWSDGGGQTSVRLLFDD